MNRQQGLRLAFGIAALILGVLLTTSYAGSVGGITDRYENATVDVEPSNNTTVVTTSPRRSTDASIVAFAPDGSVAYYNETYDYYFDVDPVSGTDATVEYAAVDLFSENCAVESRVETGGVCSRNVVERVDLVTGETTRIHSWASRPIGIGGWHDVDRLNDSHLVVAGGVNDRVFIVNTDTELIEWQWEAQSNFDLDQGGRFPADYSHINDVTALDDGRIMVSLRNLDTVVFLDPASGVLSEQSLGSDNAHGVLYEQHNPDYIPEARGGPAVVVADSENNRIVEYQRTASGEWNQSWVWQDATLQWGRDADRLPNGNTLITDSNGNRIIEINRAGDVVWSVPVDTPYEAERIETGDESTGGSSASRLGLESRSVTDSDAAESQDGGSPLEYLVGLVKESLPAVVSNGILFILPPWVGVFELLVLTALVGLLLVWGVLEFYWSSYALRLPVGRT